uniref:Predicted protein n=1 Tax=Hordeum vulgare subsp. vulgare TaxID=112509 RepID=F2DAK7_HORVV|nr:predicted protein [Hordeum vulgare subsp. vulgare]
MAHLQPAARNLKAIRPASAKSVAVKDGHRSNITCIAWSCDGQTLATGGEDKDIKIWQYKAGIPNTPFTLVRTGNQLSLLDSHISGTSGTSDSSGTTATESICSIAFSPRHPDILAVASQVEGWNPMNQGIEGGLNGVEIIQESGSNEKTTNNVVEDNKWAKSPRPKVRIWNVKTRQPITTILLSHNPVALAFHPSSYQFVAVCMDKSAIDYSVICWQQLTNLHDLDGAEGESSGLSLETPNSAPDPETIQMEKARRKIDVERKQARQRTAETEGDEGWTLRRDVSLVLKERVQEMKTRGYTNGVSELNGAIFSPCGTRLYTGNHDGSVHVWEYPLKSTISTEPPADEPEQALDEISQQISQETIPEEKQDGDSEMLLAEAAVGNAEPEVAEQMNASSTIASQPLRWMFSKQLNQGCINCIEMDPRRRYYVTGGSEGLAALCDLKTNIASRTFSSYTEQIRFTKASWDGEYVAIAGDDKCIQIVSTASGAMVEQIPTDGKVRALAWSPARMMLVWAIDRNFMYTVL